MKPHEPNLEMLSAHVDGMLSPDAARSMEQHLRSCEVCRRALRSERRFLGGLDGLRSASPPPDFVNAVMARVAQQPAHRPATPVAWASVARWGAAAAGVVMTVGVVLLAWLLGSGLGGSELVAVAIARSAGFIAAALATFRDLAGPGLTLLEESGKILWRLASFAVRSGWVVQATLLLLTVSLNYAFTRLVASYQRRH